jgi:hypothetical protein
MSTMLTGRCALRQVVVLLGCLGASLASAGPAVGEGSITTTRIFGYTGGEQTFVVPEGVTELSVTAYGAQGYLGDSGAKASATLKVKPAQQLFVEVGGAGKEFNATKVPCGETICDVAAGGFNGGGDSYNFGWSGWPGYTGGGGGGASDVQTQSQSIGGGWKAALPSRLIVAGGGGGSGGTAVKLKPSVKTAAGGLGGYLFGGSGDGEEGETLIVKGDLGGGGAKVGGAGAGGKGGSYGGEAHGSPGTVNGGYLMGYPGVDGELGVGGNGGTSWNKIPTPGAGGGGGGGYYGGGGGGAGSVYDQELAKGAKESDAGAGGGGGAGSSYAPGGTTGWASSYTGKNGEVLITYSTGEGKPPGEAEGAGKGTGGPKPKTEPEPTLNAACPTFAFQPPHLPDAAKGTPYSQQVLAFGGTPPYAYSPGQTLPAGMTLTAAGLLGGTPTVAPGLYPVGVAALDAVLCAGSASYVLRVGPPNVFGMSGTTSGPDGVLQLSVRVPGPGSVLAQAVTLAAGGAGAARRPSGHQLYGTARVVVRRAGRVRIAIKPTRSIAALLRHTHRLRLKITVTFTPTGGTPHSEAFVKRVA